MRIPNAIARAALDHPIRHVLQNSAMGFSPIQALAESLHRTGAMNDPDIVSGRASRILAAARDIRVAWEGVRIAEIGPGHTLTLGGALILAGAASAVAVDTVSRPAPSVDAMHAVALKCRELGLVPSGRDTRESARECLTRLRYAIVSDRGAWPIDSGSLDFVYSFSVLEHVRDLAGVLAESARILKPGGICAHSIDLRDHYHLGPGHDWLRFLRYDDWLWDLMASRRSSWCNRLRAPEIQTAFAREFELVSFEQERRALPDGFDPRQMARRFRGFDETALGVSFLWVVARRR